MNKNLIWIKAKCDDYYKFISKLQYTGIRVYDIKYKKKEVSLLIEPEGLDKLKKYLVSYKFKKIQDIGFNALKKSIIKNHLFLSVLFLGIIIFFLLTNVIVKVNIIHENKEIRELVEDELKSYGIKVLSFKKSYDKLTSIKQKILDEYPDTLDWIEIETIGMTYNVKIEERIITDTSKNDKLCDIVASKNGVISNIKVFNGDKAVDIDDYVRKGDTLIKGTLLYNEEEKRNTCASGEVYATVWYTVSVSIPFEYNEFIRTGKKKSNLILESYGIKKQLFKDRFKYFDSEYKLLLDIFDYKLMYETEYETKKITKSYNETEALDKALEKAEENIKIKLKNKDTIIDKKVLKKVVNNSTMDLDIFIIVEELISEELEIQKEYTKELEE